jgi:hypothetical protein
MLPNLQEATQEYWQKLNELEAAYQQGKISQADVDMEVAFLMAELGRKRKIAIRYFLESQGNWVIQQRETLIGLAVLIIISYFWFLNL